MFRPGAREPPPPASMAAYSVLPLRNANSSVMRTWGATMRSVDVTSSQEACTSSCADAK